MSKRKVSFAEEGTSKSDKSRRFKEKHSLDSDEEDDVKEERLDEDDIEGIFVYIRPIVDLIAL